MTGATLTGSQLRFLRALKNRESERPDPMFIDDLLKLAGMRMVEIDDTGEVRPTSKGMAQLEAAPSVGA